MLRTILFGSALLACLVVARVTAPTPSLVGTPAPAVPAAATTAAASAARAFFTASRAPALPGNPAAGAGL